MKRKGFTLVELIIVITIIAILASIWFLKFGNYTKDTRDTVRIADLKNIEKAIHFYELKYWEFPSSWDENIFWEEQFSKVEKLSILPIDPLNKQKYKYEVSEWWTVYKLEAILENGEKYILTNKKENNLANNNSQSSGNVNNISGSEENVKDDSIYNITDIRETNNIVNSSNRISYDNKNRITRIEIRDNRRLYNWVYYKWLKIKFTKEIIDKINTIKATSMRVDDWWELKVNWKSVISWPFPRIKWLVFCNLENQNIINYINSDLLQIDDPYDIIDDRELNAYNDIWNTSDFYNKYKISQNNDCNQDTTYWLEQMWTWTITNGRTIHWAENNITTPYIWIWNKWNTLEKANYIYEAENFKNVLIEWYNKFDLTAFVWWSWNISTTIDITYNE